jgi:hypothetical protein
VSQKHTPRIANQHELSVPHIARGPHFQRGPGVAEQQVFGGADAAKATGLAAATACDATTAFLNITARYPHSLRLAIWRRYG